MIGQRSKQNKISKMHRITKYYDTIEKKRIQCRLCPNNCVIGNEKTGLCKARINIDGSLYSVVYGYPCSLNIDPIEKKPLYHYHPGRGILSFGTYGCNLFCKGCQNFDITRKDASKDTDIDDLRYYSPQDIVDMALKNGIRMIAYTYNEPTIFFEYMIDIARLAKKCGIKNVIVSNGYINPEPLKELCKYIDAANIDIKGITEKFYKEYSRTKLAPVLETVKTLHKEGIWIELTNLLIPGLNDDAKDIRKLPLHFSRFYPYHDAADIKPTSPKVIEDAKNIALKTGLRYVYMGNLGSLGNTYCKKCGKILIERERNDIHMTGMDGKNKNRCARCKTILPGIFI